MCNRQIHFKQVFAKTIVFTKANTSAEKQGSNNIEKLIEN